MDEEFCLDDAYLDAQTHWGWRIAAYFIDLAVIAMIFMLVLTLNPDFTIRIGLITLFAPAPAIVNEFFPIFLFYGVMVVVYSTIMEALFYYTLGKWLCNLRVYALDGEMTLATAFVRNSFSKLWWLVTFLDFVIGVLFYT